MILSKEEQARKERLEMLVTVRVEEYYEAPQEENTSIPFGDIEYELIQAARYVMRRVPRNISFFGSRQLTASTVIEIPNKNGGIIPLPSDYLRFTRVKMDGWSYAVNEYMSDVSKAYNQQQYEMRRGTAQKPVAFLIPYAKEYNAGTAPAILAQLTTQKVLPYENDELKNGSGNNVARVLSTDDPDYVFISVISSSGYTASVGDRLTHPESESGKNDGYELEVKYTAGQNYKRRSKARQALEIYPYLDGSVEEFAYVPYMKPWEMPEEFEDMLIWRAVSSVLTTMRRLNDAKAALNQMALAEQAINTGIYGEERSQMRNQDSA